MTDKEFAEIKRRFKPEKNNITKVRGCFVTPSKEMKSVFEIPVGILSDEQKDWLMKLMKKPISGSVGRNLMNIEFSADQVNEGEEHKLLSDIRESELENEELLTALYEKIISSFTKYHHMEPTASVGAGTAADLLSRMEAGRIDYTSGGYRVSA